MTKIKVQETSTPSTSKEAMSKLKTQEPSLAEDIAVLEINFDSGNPPRNFQVFLQNIEDILGIAPHSKAFYNKNTLYLWLKRSYGTWIIDFLNVFKFPDHKIKSLKFCKTNVETAMMKMLPGRLQRYICASLTNVRLIFGIISCLSEKPNYNELFNAIRKFTKDNKGLQNLLDEKNIVISGNIVKIITETSMKNAKHLKELVTMFQTNMTGLGMELFDSYVKLRVLSAGKSRKFDDWEAYLKLRLQNTKLNVSNWFIAKSQFPYIFVPEKDYEHILSNTMFLIMKNEISFDFVEQNI